MYDLVVNYASTETAKSGGLFEALGIDWRLLGLQIISFAVLLWLLKKFIYPVLIKAIDKREAAIEQSVAAAHEAEANAEKSEAEVARLLKQARSEALAIIDTAHKDASAQIKEAEDKAKQHAEQIIADSRKQLERDITKARQALRQETTELVALATEKIIREKVTATKDKALIEAAIKEAA